MGSRFAKRCTAIAPLALLVAAPASAALPDPTRFSLTIELLNMRFRKKKSRTVAPIPPR